MFIYVPSVCIQTIWSGPETVIIHNVYLPSRMSLDDSSLKEGKIVSEKRYEFPAGVIPPISLDPAQYFKVFVNTEVIPPSYPVRNRFDVEHELL